MMKKANNILKFKKNMINKQYFVKNINKKLKFRIKR
jgi:hypothetical protein